MTGGSSRRATSRRRPSIAATLVDLDRRRVLWRRAHHAVTLAVAFLLAAGAGVPLGLAMGLWRPVRRAVEPYGGAALSLAEDRAPAAVPDRARRGRDGLRRDRRRHRVLPDRAQHGGRRADDRPAPRSRSAATTARGAWASSARSSCRPPCPPSSRGCGSDSGWRSSRSSPSSSSPPRPASAISCFATGRCCSPAEMYAAFVLIGLIGLGAHPGAAPCCSSARWLDDRPAEGSSHETSSRTIVVATSA